MKNDKTPEYSSSTKRFLEKHPDLKYKHMKGNGKEVPCGIAIDLDDMSPEQIKDFLEMSEITKPKES